jgi:GntR family transcriptional regulator, transcriptional repressor for pyruvate dehydrogenase complex
VAEALPVPLLPTDGSAEELFDVGAVFGPLRLRNAAEQITERFVTAIALGEFVPGQRLPSERELSSMLGVNRSSVREALHRLAGAGYVDIQRGRNGGAYVRAAWGPASPGMIRRTLAESWSRLEWLFDLRRLVEPLIARTASERRGEDDIAAAERALADYLAAPDRESSRAADQAIHWAIARATQNPYLAHLSRQLRAQVSLGFGAESDSSELRRRAIGQHEELVAAVAEGRGEDAAVIAREHFSLTEGALRDLLRRVEEGDGGAR